MKQISLIFGSILFGLLACDSPKSTPKESIPSFSFSEILPQDAIVEKLAEGFNFLEGPIWDKDNNRLENSLHDAC